MPRTSSVPSSVTASATWKASLATDRFRWILMCTQTTNTTGQNSSRHLSSHSSTCVRTLSTIRLMLAFGVMLTIDPVKDISYLLLRKTLGIKHSCQSVAFLLLVTQYGEYLRMKVAVSVAGYTELKLSAFSISASRTVTVNLVPRINCQKLTAFGYHHALQHDLHQVM